MRRWRERLALRLAPWLERKGERRVPLHIEAGTIIFDHVLGEVWWEDRHGSRRRLKP